MRLKRLAAMLLAGVLCMSTLTACGIDKNAKAASMKEQTVTLGMANFMCHYQQACVEDMYKGYLGTDDIWSQSVSGDGVTIGENLKDSAMESLHEMYTLKAHMDEYKVSLSEDEKKAVKTAAQKFISDNSDEAIKEMGADEGLVEELLTLYTIRNKMKTAIEAEADIQVSDEEANMRGYSQISIPTSTYQDDKGQQAEYTQDQKADLKKTAEKIAGELKNEGTDLENAAKDNGYEVTTASYAADDSQLDTKLKEALDDLKEGETSGMIETDTAIYFVRVDKDTDKDATEKNRQTIIETKKTEQYKKILEGWQKKDGWKIDKKALAKIRFRDSLTQQDPNASTQTQSTESQK